MKISGLVVLFVVAAVIMPPAASAQQNQSPQQDAGWHPLAKAGIAVLLGGAAAATFAIAPRDEQIEAMMNQSGPKMNKKLFLSGSGAMIAGAIMLKVGFEKRQQVTLEVVPEHDAAVRVAYNW